MPALLVRTNELSYDDVNPLLNRAILVVECPSSIDKSLVTLSRSVPEAIEEGHAIIASTSKPHNMSIDIAIQVFALKGLALPTLLSADIFLNINPFFME